MSVRRMLVGFHRYIGLLAAIPIVLLASTGAILVFEGEIDRGLNPSYWTVRPQGQLRAWQDVIGEVRKAYPADPISFLQLPETPNVAAVMSLKSGLLVSADPYTGRIMGARRRDQILTSRIHQFHTQLLIGAWGKRITGTAALLLLVLSISGVILWWRRQTFRVRMSLPWRRINYDAHYAIGFYGTLPWLLLSITGAAISYEGLVRPALYMVSRSRPADSPASKSVAIAGAAPLSIDAVLEAGTRALPGAQISAIGIPSGKSGVFQCFMKFPEDHTPAGRSRVNLDQYTGRILWLESSRTAPAGTRMWNLNRPLHTGDIFGWPTRLLACAACMTLVIQVMTGLWIWWAKPTSSASDRRPGAAKIPVQSAIVGSKRPE